VCVCVCECVALLQVWPTKGEWSLCVCTCACVCVREKERFCGPLASLFCSMLFMYLFSSSSAVSVVGAPMVAMRIVRCYLCIYVHIYTYTHTRIHICTHIHTCIRRHMYVLHKSVTLTMWCKQCKQPSCLYIYTYIHTMQETIFIIYTYTHKYIQIHTHLLHTTWDWESLYRSERGSLSAKEPLIIGLFWGKWLIKMKASYDSLRHPV